MKTALFCLLAVVSAGAGAWGWRDAQKAARESDRAAAFPAKRAAEEKAVKPPDKAALALASADLPAGPMAEWVRLLAESGPADLSALWQSAEALAPADRAPIRRLIAARWADLDPAAAWTVLHAAEEGTIVLRAWLARAPDAATAEILATADAVPDQTGRMLLREFPEAFWQLVMKTRRPRLSGTLEDTEAWEKLILAHPEEAERLARELPVDVLGKHPEDDGAVMTVGALAKARAQRDPHAALEWAKGLPKGLQEGAWEEIIPLLALSDPETAAKVINADNHLSRETISDTAELLAKTDPKAALAWLGRLTGASEDVDRTPIGQAAADVVSTALSEGRLTLEQALKAALEGPFSQIDGIWVSDFLKGTPPAKLREAAEWLKGASGETGASALESVVPLWGASEPAAAAAFVQTLDDDRRAGMLERILAERCDGGETVTEALGKLGDLPASLRGQTIVEALRHLKDGIGSTFERAPGFTESAFAAAIDATGDWDGRFEAVERLCQLWGPVDPRSAMTWALRQADQPAQIIGVATVVKEWATHDSWKASQWLAAQPVGAVRDAGAAALAESLSDEEPESAWEWAGGISNDFDREATMDKVTAAWAKVDGVAARDAVEHAAVDPETRQRLSRIIDRVRTELNKNKE